ncbi:DNA-binding protein REB1 [Meyerozyma sp. JA9]|nr:DNA-binding protein REB1 [Meyerozyma sp. JA9]
METRAIGGAKALLQLGKEGENEQADLVNESPDGMNGELGMSERRGSKQNQTISEQADNETNNDTNDQTNNETNNETDNETDNETNISNQNTQNQDIQSIQIQNQDQDEQSQNLNQLTLQHPNQQPSSPESSAQLNDAVEAAVLRYVGGTLDNRMDRPYKRRHELMNIDYQWNFLDDNDTKRKKHSDIDPELAGLDSEHDQLVQAAIMDARELAKQLGQGSLHEDGPVHGLAPHQAQQVLAEIKDGGRRERSRQMAGQMAGRHESVHDSSVHDGHNHDSNHDSHSSHTHSSHNHSSHNPAHHTDLKKFTSLDSLVNEAASMACSWYNSVPHETPGPRMFSAQEIAAVDLFIHGYCHLHKLSRQEICARIWSNERKKDNFWESLTRVLPYRSRASVYKHVRRQYHVFEVRAKWSKEDDEFLRKLAQTKQGNWKEIGDIMGRMPEDCRDRWRNYVKCGDNRSLNKWSEDEEKQLRDAVAQVQGADTDKPINWTVVSEKMNGIRSRIQCRYKWNKLLKRESSVRAASMDPHTKLWLFQKLQSLDFPTVESVDWQYLAQMYQDEQKDGRWASADFKFGFDKLKSEVKNHRKLPLSEILTRLVADLYAREGQELPPADFDAKMDSASLANAAVAAVEDNQQYLWR